MDDRPLTTKDPEVRFLAALFLLLSFFVLGSYIIGSQVKRGNVSTPAEGGTTFPPVELEAKAVYVYDARTKKVLYVQNEDVRMPLASLTKVMSALVATEIAPDYGVVTISLEALKAEGDSGLKVGEKWSLKNLLDFSLISSSNDGIHAVALALGALGRFNATEDEAIQDFVTKMNMKASDLGLKNTYYWNESGLDQSEVKGGAYGTAKDMAELLNYILVHHPELLEATQEVRATLSSDTYNHEAKNTNMLAAVIPGLLASKTGFTDTAGGNLAFVFDPELGRPIIVTILGSTSSGRFEDAEKLVAATLEYIGSEQ